MKHSFLTLALVLISSLSLQAQEAPQAPAAAATISPKLQSLTYLTEARPSADAKFYVYLSSASWCGPCRAVMPKVVAQYEEIKANGGEIILVCCDRSEEAGKAYLKKYGAQFPAVMAYQSSQLPGFTIPRGIPNATFVAADGTILHNGHGASTLNWRNIVTK